MRCRSTIESTTPTKTRRSSASSVSRGPTAGRIAPCAIDLGEVDVAQVAQAGLLDGAADQGSVRRYGHLHGVLTGVVELLEDGGAVGQQPASEEEGGEDAGGGHGDADPGEAEEPEIGVPILEEEAVDDEVGAGADEGHAATEDGGVGEGKHELRRREVVLLGPIADGGDHDGDHRRVVEEGAHDADGGHHAELGARRGRGSTQDALADPVDGARLAQACGHDVQHAHGDESLVPEAGQGLLRRQHARGHQDA